MRFSRVAVGLTLAAASLGTSLAAAGPASASAPTGGVWRAYGNTNPITSSRSTWSCSSTVYAGFGIKAQACAIRSTDGVSVQPAVIARNNSASLVLVKAGAVLETSIGGLSYAKCPPSGVAANSWSVCFGPTVTHSGPVYVEGSVGFG